MYCGQCGKKVKDNMLFCPFCGAPIDIPEQDAEETAAEVRNVCESASPAPITEPPEKLSEVERPASLFSEVQKSAEQEKPAEEAFVPLKLDFDFTARQAGEIDIFSIEPDIEAQEPAARPKQPKRAPQTYIPVKEIDPDNIFMDDDADDYDLEDEAADSDFEENYAFEEPETGNFFHRHVRGIVGVILLLMVLAICFIWAMLPGGQRALAKVSLAWKAQPYAEQGYAAYKQQQFLQSARYYEKALERDSTNYEYAHSAMVAYYEADEIEKSAAMLKKCIEMQPQNPDPYREMMTLYPRIEERPWEIQELIRLGYQRTNDPALKLN